jgi:hypothetical protein
MRTLFSIVIGVVIGALGAAYGQQSAVTVNPNTGVVGSGNYTFPGNVTVNGTTTLSGNVSFGNATQARGALNISSEFLPLSGGNLTGNLSAPLLTSTGSVRSSQNFVSTGTDVTLQHNSGAVQVFRGIQATALADNGGAMFFQMAGAGGSAAFTSLNANLLARFLIYGTKNIVSDVGYTTIPVPGDTLLTVRKSAATGLALDVIGAAAFSATTTLGDAASDDTTITDDDPTAPNLTAATYTSANSGTVLLNGNVGLLPLPTSSGTILTGSPNALTTSGGNASLTLPVRSVSTLTSNSTIATVVTGSAHGFTTNMTITMAGAAQTEYNGTFPITVVDSTTFTYTFAGSATTPATGTITATNHWVQLFDGVVGSDSGLAELNVMVQAAGSRQSMRLITAGAGQGQGGGIQLAYSFAEGWTWARRARVSSEVISSTSYVRVEIFLPDSSRTYSIATVCRPLAGASFPVSIASNSAGSRVVSDLHGKSVFPSRKGNVTVNPTSIAAGAEGTAGTGNDVGLRVVSEFNDYRASVSASPYTTLPTGLIYTGAYLGDLGQVVFRFYNATGSPIDAGDIQFAYNITY